MLVVNQNIIMHLLYLILSFLIRENQGENNDDLTFPDDFSIGTATSAYQVEGAWNIDGKTESTGERLSHFNNQTNADVSIDFYHRYKEDIPFLKELGVKHFRFSFSWVRILPTGYVDSPNKKGIQFYHNLLDELEKYNITPIATLFHLEYPQSLLELGGWYNESMPYVFADFARFIYKEFGSRINIFTTINEGKIVCTHHVKFLNYSLNQAYEGKYVCFHNLLKAHAMAFHIYDKEYRHKYKGEVGICEVCDNYYNEDLNDTEAADIAYEFDCGMIFNPIFSKKGNFSDIVLRNVAERSQLQGYNQSRLPPLSDEWVEKIRGSSDYLGLNHYSSKLVKTAPRSKMARWENDSGIIKSVDPSWPKTSVPSNEFLIVPDGFGSILRKIKNEYNNPKVYILENGIGLDGESDDEKRIQYFYSYMKEMLIAIKRDKCNVKMYTIWSFLDSFEYLCHYTCKFGLVSVDMNDKNLTRRMRKTGKWLRSVIEQRKLVAARNFA